MLAFESPLDMVIYRSRLNAKINRNFEVFTATDFLAAITQHIPDKGAQRVSKTDRKPTEIACCHPRASLAGSGCHEWQRRILPHPRSVEYKRARQKQNTYQSGTGAAEKSSGAGL